MYENFFVVAEAQIVLKSFLKFIGQQLKNVLIQNKAYTQNHYFLQQVVCVRLGSFRKLCQPNSRLFLFFLNTTWLTKFVNASQVVNPSLFWNMFIFITELGNLIETVDLCDKVITLNSGSTSFVFRAYSYRKLNLKQDDHQYLQHKQETTV